MIVTFYSFKGGVGRSMALVNVAEILADRGYRVIICDWDLEAPGLERYFTNREDPSAPWKETLARLTETPGLIDLISEYRDSLSGPVSEEPEGENFVRLGKEPEPQEKSDSDRERARPASSIAVRRLDHLEPIAVLGVRDRRQDERGNGKHDRS